MEHVGSILLYLSLSLLNFLAGILIITIPIVFGALVVSGIWWLIASGYEGITQKQIPCKKWVFGTIWASAMSLILYRSTKSGVRRGRRKYY